MQEPNRRQRCETQSQSCDQHFGMLSNFMTCRSTPCMKLPKHSGSPSRQRKRDCFMHEPHYAGQQN